MHASDLSFKKLEKAVMDSLPEAQSKGKPTDLINNHSIGGKIAFADSKERDKLTTVNKKALLAQVKDDAVSIAVTQSRLAKIIKE